MADFQKHFNSNSCFNNRNSFFQKAFLAFFFLGFLLFFSALGVVLGLAGVALAGAAGAAAGAAGLAGAAGAACWAQFKEGRVNKRALAKVKRGFFIRVSLGKKVI